MTTPMSAKIDMKPPNIDMPTSMTGSVSAVIGSMSTSMARTVSAPVTRTVSAAIAGVVFTVSMTGATGVSAATSMMTGAVSTVMAGAVSVPVTGGAMGVTVGVTSLNTGGSEHSKTGSDSQDGNDFFHRDWILDSWPHKNGTNNRRGAHQSIQPISILFHF